MNESILEEDEKVLESFYNENNEEFSDNKAVVNFIKKNDYELTQALEKVLEALLTSSSFKSAFHVQLPVKSNDQD